VWKSNRPAEGGEAGAMLAKIIERAAALKQGKTYNTDDTKDTKGTKDTKASLAKTAKPTRRRAVKASSNKKK